MTESFSRCSWNTQRPPWSTLHPYHIIPDLLKVDCFPKFIKHFSQHSKVMYRSKTVNTDRRCHLEESLFIKQYCSVFNTIFLHINAESSISLFPSFSQLFIFTCQSSSLRTVEENWGFSQQQKRSNLMVSSELLQSSIIFFT